MHNDSGHLVDLLAVGAPLLALLAAIAYLAAIWSSRRRGRWPWTRTACWLTGLVLAAGSVSGPLGRAAATDYAPHMIAHLLLGMLAPVCLTLAAPVTLLLRSVPAPAARRVVHVLRSRPVRLWTEPIVAAVLSVGGLWVLYVGGLYSRMHDSTAIHLLVHVHLLLAGWLFATAMISPDPMPYRRSVGHRAVVLILALAAHDILAKYLYAHPPAGAGAQAETGAMIMYYGGDAVDVMIMVVLGTAWYRATARRTIRRDRRRAARSGGEQPRVLGAEQGAQPGQ